MSRDDVTEPGRRSGVYLRVGLLLLAACGLSLAGYGYWIEQRVGTFCSAVRPGDPADAIPARVRADHLRGHPTAASLDRHGTRFEGYLAYEQIGFLRWHCLVEHRDGRVTSTETGFTQGT